jgi:hypothetical protein
MKPSARVIDPSKQLIFPAIVRQGRDQLGIGQRAAGRRQPAQQPGHQHCRLRSQVAQQKARGRKDPGADHGRDHEQGRGAQAERRMGVAGHGRRVEGRVESMI